MEIDGNAWPDAGYHGLCPDDVPVSYTHLRAHETVLDLVCRLLLEKTNNTQSKILSSLFITNYTKLRYNPHDI